MKQKEGGENYSLDDLIKNTYDRAENEPSGDSLAESSYSGD